MPVPSNELPYIVLAVSNFVVVLALPVKLPVTLPTTLPVTFPVTLPVKSPVTFPVTFPVKLPVTLPTKFPVTIPALKLPLPSLLTKVLTVLLELAALIVVLIIVIVDELTPPTLFTVGKSAVPPKSLASFMIPFSVVVAGVAAFVIWDLTNSAVATSVLFAFAAGVGAVGLPVNEGEEIVGDTIVLFVKVSVPANVAIVPVVGKVTLVVPILVNVVLKLPAVVKSFAVNILPPKVIVLFPLLTPVPPYVPPIAWDKSTLPSNALP